MKFLGSLAVRIAAFAFAAVTLLSACTVVVEEPRPGPPPGPRPGFCTREYDPVCARRGDNRQTFANGCLAEESGYRIIRPGECRGGGGGNDGGPEIDRACPKILDPVCARRGSDTRTFANSCRAEEAGFRIIGEGECRGGGGGGGNEQFCTREYAPVCARRGPQMQTFSNQCEAEGAGYRVVSDGPC